MKKNVLFSLLFALSLGTASLSFLDHSMAYCTTYGRGFPLSFYYDYCECDGQGGTTSEFIPSLFIMNFFVHLLFWFLTYKITVDRAFSF